MKDKNILENKVLSGLKGLPPSKVFEVVDFIDYLKIRQKNWKGRFQDFLQKIEPKMKKVTYADINGEVKKCRGR